MIDVAGKRELIDALFRKYGLSPSYEIVSSVMEWCLANGVPEDNPNRQAKCLCRGPDGAYHVVFRKAITEELIASSKDRMAIFCGLRDRVAALKTDDLYFQHLVLHEIACIVLDTTQQRPRDLWAFEQMGL